MNVQQPFLIPWMGLSNQQATAVQVAQAAAQQAAAQQAAQQQQQQQLHNGAHQQIHPAQNAAAAASAQQLQQLQGIQKALPVSANSLQLAQLSAIQQQYSNALQHAAAVAAAAAAGQPLQNIPALAAAAAAAAAQQQQQQTQQSSQQSGAGIQTSVAQPAASLLYHNSNQHAAMQMASLQGMHGLLQTPTVSTVSSLHTPQQFLAAATAATPQYSTVQKILIPGSKVSLLWLGW